MEGNIWNQPTKLDFNTNRGKFGFSSKIEVGYKILIDEKHKIKSVAINAGLSYKTYGYLPEEVILGENTGFQIGTSLGF